MWGGMLCNALGGPDLLSFSYLFATVELFILSVEHLCGEACCCQAAECVCMTRAGTNWLLPWIHGADTTRTV